MDEICDLIERVVDEDYVDRYETAAILAYKIRIYGIGRDKAKEVEEAHEGKIAALVQLKELAIELEKCYNEDS